MTISGVYDTETIENFGYNFDGEHNVVVYYESEEVTDGDMLEGMVVYIFHGDELYGRYEVLELLESSPTTRTTNPYEFVMPIDNMTLLQQTTGNVSSRFGSNFGGPNTARPTHAGIDIVYGGVYSLADFRSGTLPIRAVKSGTAQAITNSTGLGKHVIVDHGNNVKTVYGHMNNQAFSGTKTVAQGDIIGYVGKTGDSDGYHLHFEVKVNNAYKNPETHLTGAPTFRKLTVNFSANGATIPSGETYNVTSGLVYQGTTKYAQLWTYNFPKSNGLPNRSTFNISKTGHSFVGWGKTANGSTGTPDNVNVFHADYVDLKPATINPSLANGNATSTLYAIWKPYTLAVKFHVNGATIPSSNATYKVSSSLVYTKSPSEAHIQTWTYNNAKSTGLPNRSTFDIEKTGHTFVGWGKTANGSTGTPDNVNVFHADYVALKPATINSALANGTCSSTLYAIWRTNKLKVQYHANGGTIASSNANYKLTSSLVYKKSDNTVYQQGWEYNLAKPSNGLNNAGSTFGLTRSGYKFVGWGKTASESPKVNGTTVFDDDDFTVTPTKLSSNITTGDRTVTLYAIWKAN